ncbi:MAG: hypothetical protein JWL86_628 [Rhizobium sp.]|nr:hypothetical protein [Rhizobium sp.]
MTRRPSFLDPNRQQFLEKLARGKCGAVMRRSLLTADVFWRPCVADQVVGDETFEAKPEAVAAAKRFRESCREQIAQANGEA